MTNNRLSTRCTCEPAFTTAYDEETDHSPSEAVVKAVAAAEGADPVTLPPLYEFVDPDALDTLIEHHTRTEELVISFTIDTWNVFVRADGIIRVCDGTQSTESTPVFESTQPDRFSPTG